MEGAFNIALDCLQLLCCELFPSILEHNGVVKVMHTELIQGPKTIL